MLESTFDEYFLFYSSNNVFQGSVDMEMPIAMLKL